MISDDMLKNAADITLSSECEIVMVRATFIKEMAQELLQQREAERAIWKDAPEWANWFARDDDGMERFFAEKPLPSEGGWVLPEDAYDSLQSPRLTDNWQTTLQERPK